MRAGKGQDEEQLDVPFNAVNDSSCLGVSQMNLVSSKCGVWRKTHRNSWVETVPKCDWLNVQFADLEKFAFFRFNTHSLF